MAHHEPVCGQRYLNLIPRLKLWGKEALADAAMWVAGWGVGKVVAPAIMLWEEKI